MSDQYPRVGVGAIVLNKDNQILLQLRNKPPEVDHWSIPGGKVEFMETLESAIIRELKEELGIEVVVKELLCITNHIVIADNAHWVAPAYLVSVVSGTAKNLEPDSTRRLEWFPILSLPDKLTLTTKSAVEAFLNKFYKAEI